MTIAERHIQDYLDTCANVDGWVVLYNGRGDRHLETHHLCIKRSTEPLDSAYDDIPRKWVAGSLATCTVFDSYDEAVAAANEFPYVRALPPEEKRIIKIKIKTTVELQEDRPVDVLDALAEAR